MHTVKWILLIYKGKIFILLIYVDDAKLSDWSSIEERVRGLEQE